jgi:hypothetical protein
LEGSGRGLIEALYLNFPGKPRGISTRIVGVPAEVRIKHLSNTIPELYRYTNLLGEEEETELGIFS